MAKKTFPEIKPHPEPVLNGADLEMLLLALGAYTAAWGQKSIPKVREQLEQLSKRVASADHADVQAESGRALAVAFWLQLHNPMHHSVYDALEDLEFAIHDIKTFLARNQHVPYSDYLQTAHWSVVREEALERAGHRCQLCGSQRRLEVHHRTYERLFDELPEDLIVLCRHCHAKFHDKLPGEAAQKDGE